MSELSRPKVQLESPFGAPTRENIITNVAYALLAMRDSLGRREAPFASHLLYTQMLDDQNPHERDEGIEAGLVIGRDAQFTAVYSDLGVSRGMEYGIKRAEKEGRPVVWRRLYDTALTALEIEHIVRDKSPLPLDVIGDIYARSHEN